MATQFGKNNTVVKTRSNRDQVTAFQKNNTVIASKKDKDKVMLVGAMLVALCLAVVFIMFIKHSSNAKQASGMQSVEPAYQSIPIAPGTVPIYTPRTKIAAGSPLEGLDFEEKPWPRNQLPEGIVRDISELSGMYAKEDLEGGMPILRSRITKDMVGYAIPVTRGMRAVTVELGDAAIVEGWASPGKRVDVILTRREGDQSVSRVILQNAKILSVAGSTATAKDQSLDPRQAPVRRSGITTVTLEVRPEDGLVIESAKNDGRLSFLLRNEVDNDPVEVRERGSGDGRRDSAKDQTASKCDTGVIKISGQTFQMCSGKLILVDEGDLP